MAASDPAEQPAVVEQDDLVDALVQTSFLTMASLNKVGAEHDLSLTQLRVLAILRDRRLKMTDLADYLGLDKSTMTGLVDRAVKRGLLERVRNPTDGRAVDVRISPDGAALAERVYPRVVRLLSPMIGTLTPADQRRLRTLLETMLGRH
ncbi:MAG: MarR family transcriptional regulator [Actinophytocola sp.]|uniref:MarR family winged helix-turn-helix transcriptional regulator n=1 Tax=Actinophytocola sp. TaxID=1872138 RepID=UPI0013297D94|nr:MarR family transcriptional regulator [Actinophytocola sp.]MPZ81664.1 MarR family transcriptional regulator [Actinophytocola sp.]